MFSSSRLVFARRILFVVCLGAAVLIVQSKSSSGFRGGSSGVLCPRSSPHCSPVDRESRGKRSTLVFDLDDFWKKRARASFPHWQRRFRSRHRLRPDPDSSTSVAAYPAVKPRAAEAFWKGPDPDIPPPAGFWRPAGMDRSGANDPGSVEETLRTEFREGKRLDRLMEDDVEIQDGSKQRRRQEGLTRPEFNPTGW